MASLTPQTAGVLREARLGQRMLLREVAERAGVSTTIVSNVELGKQRPNKETGRRLADVLALDDDQRDTLLSECGDGRGARGPRTGTGVVTLHCRGAEAPDPRRGNRHSPRCRKVWTGPEYSAKALRSRRDDGTFVCKSCHGYEVLFRNAAPGLVQKARDKAAMETDPAKRRALKAIRMPRTWTELDHLVNVLGTRPPGSAGGGRKRIGPPSSRRLAASWALSKTKVSLCEHCRQLVFTPQYQANTQGRLNRFHPACKGAVRRCGRWTRVPAKPTTGRPREVATVTRDFAWSVCHMLTGESLPSIAAEAHVDEDTVKKAVRRIRQELPPAELVGSRFRPLILALGGVSSPPAHD